MDKGFSLLEMMLTMVLLAVGMTAIFRLTTTGLTVDAEMAKETVALALAQEKMEEIRDASSYADIDTHIAVRTQLGGGFNQFEREVTVASDPKQVDVRVYWLEQGTEQSVHLVSLFSDYDY